MSDGLGVMAASWGVLMAISPILQIRRMLNRRSSVDLSIGYLLVLQIGFGLWMLYGIAIESLVIVIPNSVAFLVGGITILLARRYRHGTAHHA